ncbi:MAG TPA: PQQ-binding-like beta-propeller repeat protein [Vicinamibacterales bacterium]|nr:PQQ-binding-like beta-propeller repeat protein [Vicinamibacterales bacterium]
MTTTQSNERARKRLRLWPGVVLAILAGILRFVVPVVVPDDAVLAGWPLAILGILAGVSAALAVAVWWLFFSRALWSERVGAIILVVAALFATSRLVHESIAGGNMGMLLYVYAIPVLGIALVVWAVTTRRLPDSARRASLVAAILLACAPWTLLRTAGTMSTGSEFHWRWTQTPEQRLLAQVREEPVVLPSTPPSATMPEKPLPPRSGDERTAATGGPATRETLEKEVPAPTVEAPLPGADPPGAKEGAEWPGFRGPRRDGIVRGVRIETDWSTRPPALLWRRPIGPGWSSFAMHGNLLCTQEQRGDDEIVACYKAATGEAVWMHRDAVRFWESNGGAGPRATPTVSDGRVYSLGATGILNALDSATGAVLWSRNAADDTGAKVPYWGFSSSPLVVGEVVIVYAGGLAAYDRASGDRRWVGKATGVSYSSPHLAAIGGVAQILQLTGAGVMSVAPEDGALLWEHAWSGGAIVQPALTPEGDVVINAITTTGGIGTRRLAVSHGPGGWSVEERWTSIGLKPYFNDFVVHEGHAYGFDGSILACIDLEDGTRKWKGGRYGNGQLVLLPRQDLMLVLSEEGELALVRAAPDRFTEVARFPAIEGKTWNHPVLVDDLLVVRNGAEMAAFRLSLAR